MHILCITLSQRNFIITEIIVLQYTAILSNLQYLVHTGINNDTGILCVLQIA